MGGETKRKLTLRECWRKTLKRKIRTIEEDVSVEGWSGRKNMTH